MTRRVIAIHLPQFHPFKENDEWWGKGFTEWTNVAKAKPRYVDHYEPHLPSETGFYDLRLPEARQLQANLARESGIYGFCYYHYWFNGKHLMERPVNEILASGQPDFPFMLCWANENWARNWDGGFSHILIQQDYSKEDDRNHMRWLCREVFPDKRYIRIDGKPVFAVYKPALFPDFSETVATWRQVAQEEFGMEIYVIATLVPGSIPSLDVCRGADAMMDFQPIGAMATDLPTVKVKPLDKKEKAEQRPSVYNYPDYVDYCTWSELPLRCYPCVSPGFDNSPRRIGKTFLSYIGCTPAKYGQWLYAEMCRKTSFTSADENLVFVNAWNEWAEGNHIEPDQKWGRAYLDETKKAIERYGHEGVPSDFEQQRKTGHEHFLKTHASEMRKKQSKKYYNICRDALKDPSVSFGARWALVGQYANKLSLKHRCKLWMKFFLYSIR